MVSGTFLQHGMLEQRMRSHNKGVNDGTDFGSGVFPFSVMTQKAIMENCHGTHAFDVAEMSQK